MFNVPENVQNGSDTMEHHSTELDLPSFRDSEYVESPSITVQPYSNDDDNTNRRNIPISTLDWHSTNETQFIPGNGFDFLRGADQVYIQQTVELSDLLSNVESENRYTVKIPRGETLFYATEESTGGQRLCCGSNRAFRMKLYDQTQQEALRLERRMACGMCSIWCYLHYMQVLKPNGEQIGWIQQQFSLTVPRFHIFNKHKTLIYRVEGPMSLGCFSMGKEAYFKIYSPDGMTQLGSINHHWDQVQSAYNLCLQFPNRREDSRHKALLLGIAFLLEYMYFMNAKKSGFCNFC
ncbi:PREDICTED: phospholipid scramblase 1-like [Nicrophorus vespilloides]|uniref:Phospholipid scramblase n=1 Tax=Nicrophorus vespilloides TaxID=110193 RepID=A0ABM1MNW9_NICVS|nr:PREDICTED: phospholipid scramblase 1-like [Nicrophorus vespilloides]